MSIGRNIAEFRKKRGFTQEELGAQLGVTNQAVSKWENETTLPDVMLLPGIANALGVTLDALYGIEEEIPAKVRADDFPAAANNMLTEYFIRQAGAFPANSGEPGDHIQLLGCVSNTAGAVFVSRNFSFIENDLGTPGSERIFERGEAASALKKLADPDVRKVSPICTALSMRVRSRVQWKVMKSGHSLFPSWHRTAVWRRMPFWRRSKNSSF